jgi:hypothetical protein
MKPAPGSVAWPVRVAPLGPVAMGSTLWRSEGQLYATAVAKATFAFTLDEVATCIAPMPIRRADECARGVPSLAGASEIAPRMTEVDVVLVGHAFAPAGTTKSTIRLVVMAGEPLLDKSLLVYGKRKPGGKPKPFERMRIGYERALGGLSFPENPIGTGADDDCESLPNVVHPGDPKGTVGGFGPIPSRFKGRRDLRGKVDPELMQNGIVDYPAGFDWRFFQAAPIDQRLSALAGDEWIMLDGLHPSHTLVRTRLPSARALATLYSRRPGVAPSLAELKLDTLHIEADDNRLSLLWRGAFPIMSELAAGELVIAGALELPGKPLMWPQSIDELEALASPEVDATELAGGRDDELQRTGEPVLPTPAYAVPTATPPMPQAVAEPAMASAENFGHPGPAAFATPAPPLSAPYGVPEAPPSAPYAVPAAVPSAPYAAPAAVPSAPYAVPAAVPSAPYAVPAPAPSAPYAVPAAAPSVPYAVPQGGPPTPYAVPQVAPSAPYAAPPAAAPPTAPVAPASIPYAVPTPPIAAGPPAAPARRPPPPRRASYPVIQVPPAAMASSLDVTHQIVELTPEADVEVEVEELVEPNPSWETTAEMDDDDQAAAELEDRAAQERKS